MKRVDLTRIAIEVPSDDGGRDEVERRTFDELDAIRAAMAVPSSASRRDRIEEHVLARVDAMRTVERADSYTGSIVRVRRPVWQFAFGGAALAAAAIAIVLFARRDERRHPLEIAPIASTSQIVTPVGGASRFTVGDAVIDAGSDTSVEVTREPSGAVTLVLARGSVDCDVEHRPGRAPFRVVAAEVAVRVVGTRFAVSRSTSADLPTGVVRVDVTRGKVAVTAPGIDRLVGAGETWSNALVASAPPMSAPTPTTTAVPSTSTTALPVEPPRDPRPVKPTTKATSSTKSAYEDAQRLEARDRRAAALAYRDVANGQGAWAALALFSLAELEAGRGSAGHKAALVAIAEYLRRFPRGANAEDAAWLRVEVSQTTKDVAGARDAARDYLRRFPAGTFEKSARRIADAP